jgi:hypothetical protein
MLNKQLSLLRISRFGLLPIVVVCGLLCTGCGSKGDIKGKVTFKDKTVVYGTVNLIDSEGVPHPGVIDPQGNYLIRGVPIGLAKLAVNSPDPKVVYDQVHAMQSGRPNRSNDGKKGKGNADKVPKPDPEVVKNWVEITQPNVGDPEKSGLTIEVKSGENPHNIQLK